MDDVVRITEMILEAVSNPFRIRDAECRIGISIGVALFPLDGTDADPLLSAADSALYHVKGQGGGQCHFPARGALTRPH
jgi:predicted signal transduction protein with EAL and GGDEF domain